MMKQAYLIEFGGKKEKYEMDALELPHTMDSAVNWIQGSMESDSEYFNCYIDCSIIYEDGNDLTTQHCNALVYIDADDTFTEEMSASDVSNVEDIIEDNLSVVSKIIAKGELKEVSE